MRLPPVAAVSTSGDGPRIATDRTPISMTEGSLRRLPAIGFAVKESSDVDGRHGHSVAIGVARHRTVKQRKRSGGPRQPDAHPRQLRPRRLRWIRFLCAVSRPGTLSVSHCEAAVTFARGGCDFTGRLRSQRSGPLVRLWSVVSRAGRTNAFGCLTYTYRLMSDDHRSERDQMRMKSHTTARSRNRRSFGFANLVSIVALFFALTGGAYAALQLPSKSVGTFQLKNGAVTLTKISHSAQHALRAPLVPKATPAPKAIPAPKAPKETRELRGIGEPLARQARRPRSPASPLTDRLSLPTGATRTRT